ncbi:MAG: V-type ATP synthase subunit I, partial [Candidatus Woesearchaeota archaeon]
FYTHFTYEIKENQSKKYTHDIAKKHNATVMLNNEFGLLIGLQKEKEILISTLKKQGVSFISPVETIQSIHEDKHILPRLIEEKKHAIKTCLYEIHTLQVKYEKKLHKVITELEVYHTRFNIASKIAVTKYTCVLEGYVSQKDYGTLRDILIKYNGTLSALSTTKGPTKLSNLKYIRSYEIITKMFGLPKTTKTDPTIIMAFFIPFFFGLMFSDVGYGFLVSATSAILLRKGKMKRNSGMYDAGVILGACSLSTIFFGFLFGSFFGTLVPLTPLLFDPFVNAQYLLLVALGIGIIHLNLAHCIGVYEYIKERDYKTLLENTGSFVTLELGLLLLFFHRQIAYILLATSVGLFIKKSSLQGLLDITGVFGTWFSYARILALSLATGGIALGINIMAREIGSLGIFGLIMSTLLLLFGHAFNYILNILGCTIHSVRLHFVEFFSQYYEPGGIEFKPYGFKDK